MFGGQGGGGGQLALNQLLIVMDGIDNPPFFKRTMTNRLNTFLDALYIVPRRIGSKVSLRLPHAEAGRQPDLLHRRDQRPDGDARPGAHAARPDGPPRLVPHADASATGSTSSTSTWRRSPTTRTSTREKRRDELARVTNGYSPAMIEQVCSMALTIAHHDGRMAFSWEDIVEAMTTVESGTAIGTEYVPEETRAVALHEAGHAAAAHVYMKGAESTRLSIRRRGAGARPPPGAREGGALQLLALRGDGAADLGARRDGRGARLLRRELDRRRRRRPERDRPRGLDGRRLRHGARSSPELNGRGRSNGAIAKVVASAEGKVDEIMQRFEQIGLQIMNRTGNGGALGSDPLAGVLGDRDKRALAAQLLGQAYVTAYALISHNKKAVEQIAEALIEKKELFGDELVEILESAKLKIPKIDLTQAKAWPAV